MRKRSREVQEPKKKKEFVPERRTRNHKLFPFQSVYQDVFSKFLNTSVWRSSLKKWRKSRTETSPSNGLWNFSQRTRVFRIEGLVVPSLTHYLWIQNKFFFYNFVRFVLTITIFVIIFIPSHCLTTRFSISISNNLCPWPRTIWIVVVWVMSGFTTTVPGSVHSSRNDYICSWYVNIVLFFWGSIHFLMMLRTILQEIWSHVVLYLFQF